MEIQDNSKNRERALLLDVSNARNSSQACQLADEFVAQLATGPSGVLVDINAGDLLLTRGVLTKIKQQIQRVGAHLGTVYATVPQTQQAGLDEGLFVKERLSSEWRPIRQALPGSGSAEASTRPTVKPFASKPGSSTDLGQVDLPSFSSAKTVEDFTPVAPQTLDIPELAEPKTNDEALSLEMSVIELSEPLESLRLAEETGTQEVVYPETAFDTLYLRQTLRSGQTVRFHGNVVIVGDVHAGSELTAGGDILVWGELRGIAHAGAQGNYKSEIRAMKIEALQLRIADYIARRPDRIYYHKEGSDLGISPEVARVADGEIKIFKTSLPKS